MWFRCCVALLAVLCCSCDKVVRKSWHEKYGWEAETYFEDGGVVELCDAIERNNLDEVERLIASGVDVNALGRGGMTPLVWAFPDGKFERFELLLKHGADPSIVTTSDFGTAGKLQKGTTVAHETAMLKDGRHFLAIVRAGVDPDLKAQCGRTELNLVQAILSISYKFDSRGLESRVVALLRLKPNQSTLNEAVATAINSSEFGIALRLFEAGAELEKSISFLGYAAAFGLGGTTRRQC
ncbi:MAG TPA: hypothetical protein DDW52_15275 [Planctomycetaceae bacterium]|nr:hypothetical protein [Planctomycetaceae bacterium]